MKRYPIADVAKIARALANPLRVQIVQRLSERGELTCDEATRDLGRRQSTMSLHISALRRAGIIIAKREHPRVLLTLNKEALAAVCSLAA